MRTGSGSCAPRTGNAARYLPFPFREPDSSGPPGCRKVRRAAASWNPDGSGPSPLSKQRRSAAPIAPRGGTQLAASGAKCASEGGLEIGRQLRSSGPLKCRSWEPAARRQSVSPGWRRLVRPVDKLWPFDSFDSAKMSIIPGGSAFSYRRAESCSRRLRGVTGSRSADADMHPKSAVLRWIHPAVRYPRSSAPGRRVTASKTSSFGVYVRRAEVGGMGFAGVESAAFAAPATGAGRLGRDGHERVRFWGWKTRVRAGRDAEDDSGGRAGIRRERLGA